METINERVKYITDKMFNGNVSAFSRRIHVPQPTLKDVVGGKLSTPRADLLIKIVNDKSLNISSEWLLRGEGEMFRNGEKIAKPEPEPISIERLFSIIESQQRTIENLSRR